MAGAWKSSDGGTITQLGASSVHVEATTTQVIVAAALNVRGITIRTSAFMYAGTTPWGFLTVDGIRVATVYAGSNLSLGRELFVPAGKAIGVERQAGTIHVDLTYDIH